MGAFYLISGNEDYAVKERANEMMRALCGDAQVLARMKAFWEYIDLEQVLSAGWQPTHQDSQAGSLRSAKVRKAIMKASTLARYREAVSMAKGKPFCDR